MAVHQVYHRFFQLPPPPRAHLLDLPSKSRQKLCAVHSHARRQAADLMSSQCAHVARGFPLHCLPPTSPVHNDSCSDPAMPSDSVSTPEPSSAPSFVSSPSSESEP
ncbi:hypothetical protein JDV02_004237 [Purpureocillium takamizusanense]|uniref:Uncharacterized protein n=1 Tax=Purpureocillium takamizusanense TaxID=2060973 RepID=A0A9Q8VAK9_9HYPO|nr:uncharacterized protein JDV02_004237 [Purpureocillium takamizusanense]UNI17931.1 hypothetical protein JDV02_004237 [Purpureocillium takamizusanense]